MIEAAPLEPPAPPAAVPGVDPEDVLLTRTEASAFLLTLGIRLKPASLARAWCMGGDGPPCVHIRRKPYYPREVLRRWAAAQMTGLRTSAAAAAGAEERP